MAIRNIEKDLDRFLHMLWKGGAQAKRAYKEMDDLVKAGKWHKVIINVKKFTDSMIIANKTGLQKATGWRIDEAEALLKQEGYFASWNNCIKEVVAKFSNTATTILTGTFKKASGYGDVLYLVTSSKKNYAFYIEPNSPVSYNQFVTQFRNDVQDCWFRESKDALKRDTVTAADDGASSKPGITSYSISHEDIQTFKPGTKTRNEQAYKQGGVSAAHQRSVILAYLEKTSTDVQAGITADIQEFDLFGSILAEAKWTWTEDSSLTKSPYHSTRAVNIIPGSNKLNKYEGPRAIEKLKRAIKKAINSPAFEALDPASALYYETSVPFAEQARAAAQYKLVRELMLKNKRYAGVTAIVKTKAPKDKKGKPQRLRNSFTSRVKNFSISIPKKVSVSKGTEKGQGQEASTSQAADLARLKKYIQGRLPAEVRRNMGRPALRNITGRFSNSIQLISLTQAKATIMAKYTYLLSPYQTFENTGRKRWPMAYNPKLLIAKSIRNLAQGRIEQKLTVRRV